jgi:exodeoxyribonuclease V gamma subunit
VLHLHRSSRADHLVDALGDILLQPLADPMAREVVAVPTRGVERWLAQRLSHRLGARSGRDDGVSANIDFPFPGTLVATALAAADGPDGSWPDRAGPDGAGPRAAGSDRAGAVRSSPAGAGRGWVKPGGSSPAGDPWSPERAVWPLLEVVDDHFGDPFMRPLAAHLRASSPGEPNGIPRRFTAVRHLADLYDHYAVHRPDMLLAWLRGSESALSSARPEDMAWQAELWRLLRQRLNVPSPAERLETAPSRIEAQPELLDLPSRISLFGLTRLPSSHLQVLKAIGAHRDVHLFLLHPSDALWEEVATRVPRPPAGLLRQDDPTARLARNPLLRSWGRDAREMQLVLAAHGVTGGTHGAAEVQERATTLLRRIQADVRADRPPPGPRAPSDAEDPRSVLAEDDDSLRVHSCHGRARQVEVVREAVLHLLADDPTLEPRDVIVMCPDIELFAPLVSAAFGAAAEAGAPELRARLADRSLRQTNPMLAVAAHLLELAGSRATASDVLDFASREPVSRRFGLDISQEALSRVEHWLAGTGVRWGLDAPHRRAWKLGQVEAGTWRAGMDRLLLGVAMAEDERLFGGTLPFGDLSSDDIALAGRLAELVERLTLTLDELAGPQTAQCWARALADGTARLAASAPDEAWQDEQLRHALEDIAGEAGWPERPAGEGGAERFGTVGISGTGATPVELDLSEARALLADRLRGRPTRANFRTGDMTICTLVPMRSVPHRAVCLLGLDDGLFPRPREQDGDDLLLADPQVGDRDVPSEDRQLLLDALLAATEHLVITFEGRDQHLNQRRPPAVPVAELLDVVDKTVRLSDPARAAREAVVVDHPLQAFNPDNFAPGLLHGRDAWRFDEAYLEGARAVSGSRRPKRSFLPEPLPPRGGATVQLSSLVRFLEHPVRAFLRERLGFYAADIPDPPDDALVVEMTPLERWALGDRLLEARLGGADLDKTARAERGRGLLPPGPLGNAALADVIGVVQALVAEAESLPCSSAEAVPVEVNLSLPGGSTLVGTVPGVHRGVVRRCMDSKLGPKHRLRAWALFLALSATRPEIAPSAVTIGQAAGSSLQRPRLCISTLRPLADNPPALRSAAIGMLQVLVDLYQRGMREPLPIFCTTSAAWASARFRDEDPRGPARAEWTSSSEEFPAEDAEPEHLTVLGTAIPFEEILEAPPAGDETGDGWETAEGSRFGRLALRLWQPVLRHERLKER